MTQRRRGNWRNKRQQPLRRRHSKKPIVRSRALRHELLEDRSMFALLGVAPLDLPIVGYDSGGTVDYDASTDSFSITAVPLTIESSSGTGFFFTGTLNISIQVDGTGALVGGVPGDDLVLVGDVDVDGDFIVDFSGTLLTGEVLGYGSEDSGGDIDLHDFRFSVTGGQLASMFSGKDLGVTTTSENSSFVGDFNVDFGGDAKGSIGAIDPLDPGIDIEKFTNGVDADNPMDAPEIPMGDSVTFTYQVTNTGSVAFAYDDVLVTDDNGTPGDSSDDVSTTSGELVLLPGSDVGGDLILSPGEIWEYEYTTTALDLDPSEENCGCEVGTYENIAVVTVPGATDSDLSHYTNPSDAPPCIGYDSGGTVNYDAATDHFSLDATPLSTDDGGLFFSGSFAIDIIVDGTGALVGGVPGDDLVLIGDLDTDGDFIVDYSGTLLTGEIISFLSTDSGGNIDTYEFRFVVTGGLLAAQYMGMDLLVETTSENSTFAGSFASDFSGNAKGEICCTCQEEAGLSGHKYTDITGDGQSGDDTPLSGVTINLYQDSGVVGVLDGADVLYASDVTDINGEYSFDLLPPGSYLVEEVVPAGYMPTSPTVLAVTLVSGDHITTGFDFANFQLGSLSGLKFQDNNGDGIQNGSDAGLAGWTIELDKDANGTVDATTVTGAGGVYSFTGLTAGTYRVREVGQVGWIQTTVNPGDAAVVSGTNSTGNDFGNFQLGSLSGKKFRDNNGDGNLNGSDAGLSGWTIELDKDANGTVDATTVTGAGGMYSFTGLVAGTYRVREQGQAGWIQTTVNPGDVAIVSGTSSTNNNFGNFQLGSISGKKFKDNNGDGILNGSDAGLAGWTIQLDKDANGTVDFTTITGAGGTYSFTGLTAGVYRIREVGQAGWIQTTVNPGDVTVVSGTSSTNNYFGNRQLVPGIDLEKTTNGPTNSNPTAPDYDNEDSDNGAGVPILTVGSTVTWTYKVSNTGETNYSSSEVVIVDDNGTTATTADDMSTTNGQITFLNVQTGDADNVLEPGEVWLYKASGIVQNVGSSGSALTFNFSGNSPLDGTDGNIRTFSTGGVSVKASAFSRDIATGAWQTAYLGSYGGGLGVTDASEGNGSNNTHTVDNVEPRDNYVLFEFSETVILDSAFLGYVVDDSDLKIWIGTKTDPFNNHQTLSDAFLTSLGFTEINETTLTTTRLADLNAGNIAGNVIVIAANPGEPTREDKFKIEKLTVKTHGCYENKAVVTVPGATDFDYSHYCNPSTPPNPKIDIEKLTNGVDADNPADAPEIAPGDTVTWTYRVTNTGNVAFTASQVVVTDDNGTAITSDDFVPTRVLSTDVGSDGILSPGEVWEYTKSAQAQELLTTGASTTIDFSGSSSVTGSAGNTRTFSANGVSVKTSAFSRDNSGVWSSAYLGSYSGGLGVTDGSENGSSDTHTVDNIGRDNYVLFEFSKSVVIDSAFLGYVVGDSDLKIWIGTATDPFNNHLTLSDSVLAGLGFTEVNETTLTSTRLADLNAGGIAGNVLVIAANVGEPTEDDKFKIEKVSFGQLESGIYKNVGKVIAGGVSDTDVSHYKNPDCVDITYAFAGNTAVTGTKGNVLTYTQNNVSVNASAFSRTTAGAWSTAYLGAYSDGLGVTDPSENGSGGTHRVDNVGQMNFVLFEFSTHVTIDRAFLDSIAGDSDISVWIGTADNPFHNHLTLSDSLSSIMTYADTSTGGSSARWADFNPGGVSGNVLVIAAKVDETNDQFKISKLDVCAKAVKFYVVDGTADDTFEYGPTGQALANYNLNSANTGARGVATTAAGDKVWVLDSNKKVYVYNSDGKLLGSWTASGLTTPEDITTNGTDIWIVDDGSNKVFKFAGAATALSGTKTATSSFGLNSANANAKGVVTDGAHLWVVNDHATSADKVFKYTTAGSLVGSWTIDARNSNPTGITIDPSNVNHIWIVDSADDAVYRYQAAAGKTSGSLAAASLFQLASGNVDAQGIADPPPTALEVSLPAAAALPENLFFNQGGLSIGAKYRTFGDQSASTWAETWHSFGSVRRASELRFGGSTTAGNRSSNRYVAAKASLDLAQSIQAPVVDSVFDISELNSDANEHNRNWSAGKSWAAIDDLMESPAEDAVFEAFAK